MSGRTTTATPDWTAVEELLARLAATRATFTTPRAGSNAISAYEPGQRLRRETDIGSSWVRIDHIRACWETFERLGRVGRSDVLEPGRCAEFMLGLFGQVGGVSYEEAEELFLVLPERSPAVAG